MSISISVLGSWNTAALFEHEQLDMPNYQGNAVVNYTEAEMPFTRIIEHKHFEFGTQPTTVITREYPENGSPEWNNITRLMMK